jgi:hypothetical protein
MTIFVMSLRIIASIRELHCRRLWEAVHTDVMAITKVGFHEAAPVHGQPRSPGQSATPSLFGKPCVPFGTLSFHQLNKNTGHRIKYRKVDADTGDEVESADIIKGYEVGKGEYLELDPEELDAIAIESKDRFTSAHDARKRTPKTLVLSAGIRLEGNADDSSLARNVNQHAQGRLHLSYDSRRSSRARSVHREIQRPRGRCLR